MEKALMFEPLLGYSDPFGEGRINSVPKHELLIPDNFNYYALRPKRHENALNRNTILLPRENNMNNGYYSDLSDLSDLIFTTKLDSFKNIEPKPVYGKPLRQQIINDFSRGLQIQNKQLFNLNPLPTSLLNGGNVQKPFGNYLDLGATKPEDLPEMALPVLEFMEDVQPHIVIGCDRGGRLFGLAMHAAWQHTRDGQPFPTLDGKLHFARVSKSEDPDVLQEKIDEIVKSSKQFGKQRGNELADNEQLRVLFVDDWVIGGGTMRLAQRLMKKHNAQTYFAVMCGDGADATGRRDLQTRVSWHDRPEEIGVNYLSTLEANPDGTVTQKQEVIAVRGVEAIRNRQRIQQAARQLAFVCVLGEVA